MELGWARLRFSSGYALVVLVAHGLASMAVIGSGLGWLWQMGLGVALIGSGCWAWRQPNSRVVAISFDGSWQWVDGDGVRHVVSVGEGTVVTRFFVLLCAQSLLGQKLVVPLFWDSLSTDEFRRVQVILRLELDLHSSRVAE